MTSSKKVSFSLALAIAGCLTIALIPSCSGSNFAGSSAAQAKKKSEDQKKKNGGGTDAEEVDTEGLNKEGRFDNDSTDEVGGDHGKLACASPQPLLKPGENAVLKWTIPEATSAVTYSTSGGGTVSGSGDTATFTAPATVGAEIVVAIVATSGSDTAECKVKILANNQIFTEDDGISQGLKGNVYQLAPDTPRLPDLSTMTPLSTILAPNLDVPLRSYTSGFPGVPNLLEWFAIRFEGKITIDADGVYYFKLTSDDGSNLYLNDTKIVDNDGVHSVRSAEGSASLTKGKQKFRIDYYQGPRDKIAFQVFWKKPGESTFSLVPASVLGRP